MAARVARESNRIVAWLYVLIIRARFAAERANGYRLVPGVPPSPLYQLMVDPGVWDWDTAFERELGGL